MLILCTLKVGQNEKKMKILRIIITNGGFINETLQSLTIFFNAIAMVSVTYNL